MNRLRIMRDKSGLTLLQASEALGVTPMTIQRFEKGTRNVNLRWLERLAELYKVRVAELVDDIEPVSGPANIDPSLLEEILNYALNSCKDTPVDGKTLARVISITYSRCRQEGRKPQTAQIREKIDDMLAFASVAS